MSDDYYYLYTKLLSKSTTYNEEVSNVWSFSALFCLSFVMLSWVYAHFVPGQYSTVLLSPAYNSCWAQAGIAVQLRNEPEACWL